MTMTAKTATSKTITTMTLMSKIIRKLCCYKETTRCCVFYPTPMTPRISWSL